MLTLRIAALLLGPLLLLRGVTFLGSPIPMLPLLLSLLMTFIVSLISTLRAVGVSMDVPRLWMSSWALSWLVAFPTLLLVLPLVRRATAAIVQPPQ